MTLGREANEDLCRVQVTRMQMLVFEHVQVLGKASLVRIMLKEVKQAGEALDVEETID